MYYVRHEGMSINAQESQKVNHFFFFRVPGYIKVSVGAASPCLSHPDVPLSTFHHDSTLIPVNKTPHSQFEQLLSQPRDEKRTCRQQGHSLAGEGSDPALSHLPWPARLVLSCISARGLTQVQEQSAGEGREKRKSSGTVQTGPYPPRTGSGAFS
jgi:hypothetical protein